MESRTVSAQKLPIAMDHCLGIECVHTGEYQMFKSVCKYHVKPLPDPPWFFNVMPRENVNTTRQIRTSFSAVHFLCLVGRVQTSAVSLSFFFRKEQKTKHAQQATKTTKTPMAWVLGLCVRTCQICKDLFLNFDICNVKFHIWDVC